MKVTFENLWKCHPSKWDKPDNTPCQNKDGEPTFAHQCAIRMGVCLTKAGFNLSSVNIVRCWFHNKNENHFLRAEELAKGLESYPDLNSKVEKKKKKDNVKAENYKGRKGIVYFQNFWGDGNQGDHIDLWNGEEQCRGEDEFFENAEQVWFWELH
ncbi:type VI secretion system amidase effector protein Tae4 [Fibrobacterota bacterium]